MNKWQRLKAAADQRRSERDRAAGALEAAKKRLSETVEGGVEKATARLEELKKRLAKKAAKLAKGLEEIEEKFCNELG